MKKIAFLFMAILILYFAFLAIEAKESCAETLYPGYLANVSDHEVRIMIYNNSAVEGNTWIGDKPVVDIALGINRHKPIYLPIGELSLIIFDYKRHMWHAEDFAFTKERTHGDFVLQYEGIYNPYRFLDF